MTAGVRPLTIERQINRLVAHLVEVGLAGDQNFAFQRDLAAGSVEVTFESAECVSTALRKRAYREVYADLAAQRAYNALMPDGALIQMQYSFRRGDLVRHRLAFLPSPYLERFQNAPDLYLQDEVYADIIAQGVVPFPVRFDYDGRARSYKSVVHPKSHLTLGQYRHCRIPVTAPVTPFWFIDFILRSFYQTPGDLCANMLPRFEDRFRESIFPEERQFVHMALPGGRG